MKIKFPVGTTEENNQLLLPEGYVTFDSERKALRLHDGATPGGFEVIGESPHPFKNWSAIPTFATTGTTRAVTHTGDWFVGSENGAVYRSQDGQSWSKVTDNLVDVNLIDLVFDNGVLIGVGYGGAIVTSSDNGLTWTKRASNITSNINGLGYFNGLWVAAGNSRTVLTSTDNGATWSSQQITDIGGTISFYSVENKDGTWIIVGSNGTILRSTNGVSWTVIQSGSGYFTSAGSLTKDNDGFLALFRSSAGATSDRHLWRSGNGVDWDIDPLPMDRVNSLGKVGDHYILYGGSGSFYYSVDLIEWYSIPIGPDADLHYGHLLVGDKFYLYGREPYIYTSDYLPST